MKVPHIYFNTPTTRSTGIPGVTKLSKKPSKEISPSCFLAVIAHVIGGMFVKDTISKRRIINYGFRVSPIKAPIFPYLEVCTATGIIEVKEVGDK
jgi:hypothetical protein